MQTPGYNVPFVGKVKVVSRGLSFVLQSRLYPSLRSKSRVVGVKRNLTRSPLLLSLESIPLGKPRSLLGAHGRKLPLHLLVLALHAEDPVADVPSGGGAHLPLRLLLELPIARRPVGLLLPQRLVALLSLALPLRPVLLDVAQVPHAVAQRSVLLRDAVGGAALRRRREEQHVALVVGLVLLADLGRERGVDVVVQHPRVVARHCVHVRIGIGMRDGRVARGGRHGHARLVVLDWGGVGCWWLAREAASVGHVVVMTHRCRAGDVMRLMLLVLRRRRLVLLRVVAVTLVLWSKMGTVSRGVVVHGRRGAVVLLVLVLVMSRLDRDGARRVRDGARWDEVRLLVVICMRMCMCRRRGRDRARYTGMKSGRPRTHRDRLSTNRVSSGHRGRWDRWRLWGRLWRRRILFVQGSCG